MKTLWIWAASFVVLVVGGCSSEQSASQAPTGDGSQSADAAAESSSPAATSLDSPEAVFAAFAGAMEKDDWNSAVSMITDESKQMIIMGMVMQASFMTMDDQNKGKELEALFKKHGFDESAAEGPSEEEIDINTVVADLPGFVGDLSAWITANADDSDEGFPKMTKVSDVKIDGDAATGMIETEMGPQPIEFQRVDGQWLLHLAMGPPPEPSIDELDIDFDDTGDGEIGLLKVNDQSSGLNHAFAYRGKFFDEPCINLVLTSVEISEEKQNELKQSLEENDGDAVFFADGPHVKLTLTPEGKLMSMFVWLDNSSISSNRGPVVDVFVEGESIVGRVGLVPDSGSENQVFFHATFETDLKF